MGATAAESVGRQGGWTCLSLLVFALSAPAAGADTVDLARLVASWPTSFEVRGTKTEPTWVESVRFVRQGDLFVLEGGGLPEGEQIVEAVRVTADGKIIRVACPQHMDCGDTRPMTGFLALAELVAAQRRGAAPGAAAAATYAGRRLACLPAERLGVADPVIDPCFDLATGAVLAQRTRTDFTFSGPTLDAASIRFVDPPAPVGPFPPT